MLYSVPWGNLALVEPLVGSRKGMSFFSYQVSLENDVFGLDMVVDAFNFSMWEDEAGES
jgi:hypothetical protein